MKTTTQSQSQSSKRGIRAMLGLAIALNLTGPARAAVWTFTNRTSSVWTTANSWQTNGAVGAPPIGVTNYPGRINVNATLVYNYATNTGFGTFRTDLSPEFGRGMGIASGNSTTGQVDVVTGALVFFQAALSDAVFVAAPGDSSGTSKGYLNLNGGNLMIIATNYGVLAAPFRGGGQTLGRVTINSGSTLTVDRYRFGGQGGATAGNVGAGCAGDLFLNSGGTLLVRNMANLLNPANMRATNYFNGGTLKLRASEVVGEGRNPLIGSNIVNNLMAGGLVVDTVGFAGRIVSPLMNGTGGVDGGVAKNGSGTLNLRGVGSTYNGPTVVNQGTLGIQVPMTCTDIRIQPGATNNFITDNTAPWSLPSLGLTNVSLGFDYGNFAGYSGAVVAVGSLNLQGTIKVNLVGTSFPVIDLTLLTYTSKSGGGSFALGTLPAGAVATLEDTGSALVLHITSASLQALTWTASADNTWQTNGLANWNLGTATYLEYPSGVGDIVTFDDSSSGTVNIASPVRPTSLTVSAAGSSYVFSGAGRISGPTDLDKLGTGTLQLSTSNDFTGDVDLSGGTLIVDHPKALGATNSGTLVALGSTLQIGTLGGAGVTVAEETVSIVGSGVGGALGSLRGAATASGSNVWAGPVLLLADNPRIGTEDNGNLTVAGSITDKGSGYGAIFRPGASGVLALSGVSNTWSGASQVFGGISGKVVLGADNVLPVGSVLAVGDAMVDLNGRNHSVAGLALNGGTAANAIVLNNGATPSTLTLNPTVNQAFPGNLQNGTAAIALVKNGTNSQSLTGMNTYTGATTVNGGALAVALPMSSTALTLAEATRLTVTVAGSSWSPTTMSVTNATLSLDYGTVSGTPTAVFTTTALNVSGSNVVNISGANIPAAPVTLIAYTSKSGNGTFHPGTLPLGMQATILDTGSAIVLSVTISPRTLTWYGATTGTWNTNGTLDWSFGTAAYQEYGPATNRLGDFALFDDTAGAFSVNPTTDVRPYSVTVNNVGGAYVFNGPGKISGPATLAKQNNGTLTLASANDYDGMTTISGGSGTSGGFLYVDHSNALGSTVGGTIVSGPANTLEIGTPGGNGVTVTGETLTISGTGVGGARGALRGAATVSGSNDWAGPVIIAADVSRIGTEDDGNLTVSGVITDSGSNYVTLLRPGANGVLTLSGSGNNYGHTRTFSTTGTIKLCVNNAFPTNDLQMGTGFVDLNGFNQSLTGISDNSGPGTILNNGPVASTLTLGSGTADNFGSAVVIMDGTSPINLIKEGAGRQNLAGINAYTGTTAINGGTLRVSGALGNSAVAVNSGGSLDGAGTLGGPLTVNPGGTLEPGSSAALGEVLTLANTAYLAGTTVVQIGATPESDSVAGVTDITYGGALIVNNATGATLAPGDVFTLFAASGTKTGNFTSVQVLPASLGLAGTFNPATGQLTLTPAPPTLSYANTGPGLQFSWTGSYKLQAQTNSLSVGISTNWADYPGGGTSPVTVPQDATQGSVFFRLVSP